jgi:hypothetical protein
MDIRLNESYNLMEAYTSLVCICFLLYSMALFVSASCCTVWRCLYLLLAVQYGAVCISFLLYSMALFGICALLGFYAAHVGNYLPEFRNNLSVPFLKMAPIGFPEKSVRNYPKALRNNPEERRFHYYYIYPKLCVFVS